MTNTFHMHGSLFPENYPKNRAIEIDFAPLCGKPTLVVSGTVAIHLGTGDLEATVRSLYEAADKLRLFLNERDLTPEEQEDLAAGKPTQTGGLTATLANDGTIRVGVL
jgi:hypothetical protein